MLWQFGSLSLEQPMNLCQGLNFILLLSHLLWTLPNLINIEYIMYADDSNRYILVTFYIRLQLLHTLFEVQRSVRERKNPQMCRHNEGDAYIYIFSVSEPGSGVFYFPQKDFLLKKKGSTYTLIPMHTSNSDIICCSRLLLLFHCTL